jgi:YVTN family beta-propeller protein
VVKNIKAGKRPRRFALTPDGAQLWVTNELDASVTVIDTQAQTVLDTIKFTVKGARAADITPVGITMTRDGKRAFVSLGKANHVAFVDVASRKTTDLVLVGKRAWGVALDKAEKTLYVVNGLSDDMTIVDVASAKAVKTVKVGRVPHGWWWWNELRPAAAALLTLAGAPGWPRPPPSRPCCWCRPTTRGWSAAGRARRAGPPVGPGGRRRGRGDLKEGKLELDAAGASLALDTVPVADAAAARAAAAAAEKAGAAALLTDLPPTGLLAAADGSKLPVLNLYTAADRLRGADCRKNLLHV